VAWNRHEAKALVDSTLTGEALHAALEDCVRGQNPHLTDVRVDRATSTEEYDTHTGRPRRWYVVTYVADDGAGY
jgi:hypothetical protein